MDASTATHAVLMFTDVEGSVSMKARLGADRYTRLIAEHDELFRDLVASIPGAAVLNDTGDGFLARFPSIVEGVEAALRFQRELGAEGRFEGEPVRVRVGLHVGDITELRSRPDGPAKVIGLTADLASRVMSLAEGGQILMTREVFDEGRQSVTARPESAGAEPPELRWLAHGEYAIQGREEPIEVFEVGVLGVAPFRPPGDARKGRRLVRPGDEELLGWRPAAGLAAPRRPGWALERKLGEGGFGEVWLARNERTADRRVFKYCFEADRLRSFRRELALFRRIREALGDRPDIARLHDVELERPPFFLESEFTELGDLGAWAKAQGGIGAVPLETRIRLVAETARAAAAAHSVGVLHQDIKPANILIYRDVTGEPHARLADFGIGILTDASEAERSAALADVSARTGGTTTYGTRLYAPPETIVGEAFTLEGDVYSLGVVLYQAIIGDLSRPIAAGWERDIPDETLRADVGACVDGDPANRLHSAAELADRLERLDERRAEFERARRAALFEARRRRLARVGGAVALGLGAVSAVLGVSLSREMDLRAEAERQRAIAQSINEFLNDMLAEANPNQATDADMTVRRVLDAASEEIERAPNPDPEVDARLRRTMGSAYLALGLQEPATRHAQAILDRAGFEEGADESLRLMGLSLRGSSLHFRGEFEAAERDLREVVSLVESTDGPDSAEAGDARHDLAWLLGDSGRNEEALAEYRAALEIQSALFGDDSEEVAKTLNGIAIESKRLGRLEEAEDAYRGSLAIRERVFGHDHLRVAKVLDNLGILLETRGEYEEAAEACERAEAIFRARLEPDHPDIAVTLNSLSRVYKSLGRYDEAQAKLRDALVILRATLGDEHVQIAMATSNLAELLLAMGRTDEAVEVAGEAVAVGAAAVGEDHWFVAAFREKLGRCLIEAGRYEEAEAALAPSYEILSSVLGAEHHRTRQTAETLASLYDAWDRPEQAGSWRARTTASAGDDSP